MSEFATDRQEARTSAASARAALDEPTRLVCLALAMALVVLIARVASVL